MITQCDHTHGLRFFLLALSLEEKAFLKEPPQKTLLASFR